METDRIRALPPSPPGLSYLQLLHLADSALPIGALAHSFGLETLVSRGLLKVSDLESFLRGYLEETAIAEAVFCREAFLLARIAPKAFQVERWRHLNASLSAMKPARETRSGSAALGRNFLMAVSALGDFPVVRSRTGRCESRIESAASARNRAQSGFRSGRRRA